MIQRTVSLTFYISFFGLGGPPESDLKKKIQIFFFVNLGPSPKIVG